MVAKIKFNITLTLLDLYGNSVIQAVVILKNETPVGLCYSPGYAKPVLFRDFSQIGQVRV